MRVIVDSSGQHCQTCGSFTRESYELPELLTVVVCPECKRTDGPLYRQVADRVICEQLAARQAAELSS